MDEDRIEIIGVIVGATVCLAAIVFCLLLVF